MKNVPQAISAAATENQETHRAPDCVTEIKAGNTILTVFGYFKEDATDTAEDKMLKALKAENEEIAQAPYVRVPSHGTSGTE